MMTNAGSDLTGTRIFGRSARRSSSPHGSLYGWRNPLSGRPSLLLNPADGRCLGVIAVLAAYGFACLIGMENRFLQAGLYVYNPFLVGLSLGYRFEFTPLACLLGGPGRHLHAAGDDPAGPAARSRAGGCRVLSLPFSLASSILYLVTARFRELTAAAPRLPALLASDLGLPAWLAGFFKAFGSLLFAPRRERSACLVSLLILRTRGSCSCWP